MFGVVRFGGASVPPRPCVVVFDDVVAPESVPLADVLLGVECLIVLDAGHAQCVHWYNAIARQPDKRAMLSKRCSLFSRRSSVLASTEGICHVHSS